jgi:histidyl-tRNA synthetase
MGHPREVYECDFDIVGPPSARYGSSLEVLWVLSLMGHRAIHDAEVLKVISEVLSEHSQQLGSCIIRVLH